MEVNVSKEPNDAISVKTLVHQVRGLFRYLLSKWFVIIFVLVLGALIGLWYASRQPLRYISRLTFVVEESKGGGGGLASLAGQFGFDLGGGGGGGIFNGDNVLLFLKSQMLVRETLLTPYTEPNKSLVDQYATAYNIKDRWNEKKEIGAISFYGKKPETLSRIEDSLLQTITDNIIKNELEVGRPDKKASFIEVKTSMRDEQLSKLFCDRLVSLALDRYVSSKTKLKSANVNSLQRRADSLERLLNSRTISAAASQQGLIDLNPGLKAATAPSEIRNRDKMTVAAIYTEVVKNLELAKTILNQETPTIEVVDKSSFPLKRDRASKSSHMVLLAAFFGFITICLLIIRRWWLLQVG